MGVSGGLRFAPAPPNVSCVICCANNLYPSGPSPYTCPGVDMPPDTPYPNKKVNEKTRLGGVVFFRRGRGD